MIELMIALGIIGIGLFALAAGATLVARLSGGATIQSRAAAVANSRLEQIRALSCAQASAGADTSRGIIARWTTSNLMSGTSRRGISVNLTVQYPTVQGTRTQSYRTIVPC